MMKRMLLVSLIGLSFGTNLNAKNPYQSLQNRVIGFGDALEAIDNVPVLGKLTSLLPVAMFAACLKECPGQTMLVTAGLLTYVILKNDSVRSALDKYIPASLLGLQNNQADALESDDTLFVFDGEEEEDAQEEQEVEDMLLGINLLEDEQQEETQYRKKTEHSTINFL